MGPRGGSGGRPEDPYPVEVTEFEIRMADNAPEANVVPLRPRVRPCPICGEPAAQQFRPFCSKHCANKDLLNWLRGDYRHETDEQPMDIEGGMDRERDT